MRDEKIDKLLREELKPKYEPPDISRAINEKWSEISEHERNDLINHETENC